MNSFMFFILASVIMIITPGPDLIYVLTRGVSGGRRAGVASAIGVTLGILVHTIAASLGVAVLLQTSVYAFWILKIIGGIYLTYLGIQMIRHRKRLAVKKEQGSYPTRQCIVQGFFSNVFNPKVALFFVAFLPQFIDPDAHSQGAYMAILGLIFALMAVLFLVALGFVAGTASDWFQRKSRFGEWISAGSGTILILLGVRLLTPQRA